MSLVFGICSWISEESQLPELKRCLESVKDYRVIIIDGKWKDIDSPIHASIAQAYATYRQYSNVQVMVSLGRHEWENRNLYLQKCQPGDTLIVLDTDEYVTFEHTPAVKGLADDSFHVNGYDKGKGGKVRLNRGYMDPINSYHADRHNRMFCNSEKLTFNALCEGITIHHDKTYRTPKREKMMLTRNQLKEFR